MTVEATSRELSRKIRTPPGGAQASCTPKGPRPRRKSSPCITPRPMGPSFDAEEPADLPLEGVHDMAGKESMMRLVESHLIGLRIEFERMQKECDEFHTENELLQRRLAATVFEEKANDALKQSANNHAHEHLVVSATTCNAAMSMKMPLETYNNEDVDRYNLTSMASIDVEKIKSSFEAVETEKEDSGRRERSMVALENIKCPYRSGQDAISLLFAKGQDSSKPREHRFGKLHDWFDRLVAPDEEDGLSSSRLLEVLGQVHGSHARLPILHEIEDVIRFLNGKHAEHPQENEDEVEGGVLQPTSLRWSSRRADLMHFASFVDLILFDGIEELEKSPVIRENAVIIRDALMRQHIDDLIFHFARIPPPRAVTAKQKRISYIIGLLDPVVAVVIFMNGLTIGLSSDIEWDGWDFLDIAFTAFFLLEIGLKLFLNGFRSHFCGDDWSWNWFDAVVVLLAVIDAPLSLLVASDDTNLNDFSLVRMARLARLTRMLRLIRILRLRIFRELLRMVKGVVAGLRTLFWAIVMLVLIVYACAVVMRQTVGENRHIMHDRYHTVLFGTVPWSMFNAFRCFVGDCTLPDGTPIAGHLSELYGYSFVLPYSLMTMFITFGIFNMVTAVMVENVIESAKQRQLLSKENEQRRVVESLRNLVLRLAAKRESNGSGKTMRFPSEGFEDEYAFRNIPTVPATWSGWAQAVSDFLRNPVSRLAAIEGRQSWRSTVCDVKINSEITRDNFLVAIEDPRVSKLIDDLEVNVADRIELFDVLDSDGSGCIDIGELISGIMKLRSQETKHDVVAIILGMRGIRDTLRETSARVSHMQNLFIGNTERRTAQGNVYRN